MSRHDIFPISTLAVLGALEGKTAEEEAQSLLKQEAEPPKDFRPEHLKRMGVSINKGGKE